MVRNTLDILKEISETHTLNGEYVNLVTAHMEVAAEHIPSKPKAKCRVPWESVVVRKNTR